MFYPICGVMLILKYWAGINTKQLLTETCLKTASDNWYLLKMSTVKTTEINKFWEGYGQLEHLHIVGGIANGIFA